MFTYNVQIRIPTHYGVPSGSCRLVRFYEKYDFEVRGITRLEYRNWNSFCKNQIEFEDKVIEEAVVGTPKEFKGNLWDWNEVYFGIVSQLVEKILEISGFGGSPHAEMLKKAQDYLDSESARYDRLIMMALHYKLEDLMDMEPELWHILVGQSQIVLALLGLDPELVLDPETYKQKMKPGASAPPTVQNLPTNRKGSVIETKQDHIAFYSTDR